ncbi:rhamnulokinase [Anaerolineaceae bacterium]|nr:rhamnulokinase [Anaerolineaceae bacterium]
MRCIFESLALKQRYVLERIVQVNARQPTVIHIVGGGSQNQLLCQLTADACQLPVVAGPVEATALGNVLVQAMAVGCSARWPMCAPSCGGSVTLAEYQPRQSPGWDVAYARINKLMEGDSAQV